MEIDTTLHFPTRGRSLLRVQGDLLAAHALGIHNIFVVMGDPPPLATIRTPWIITTWCPPGLIKLIKQGFNTGVDHAGADIGQPTSFFVGCALNLCPSDPRSRDEGTAPQSRGRSGFHLDAAGLRSASSQHILKQYADRYGPLQIPILAGVLPLFGTRHAAFLDNEVPGISIQDEMHQRLRLAGEKAPYEGVRIALELIEQMREWASGAYLMPAFQPF